MLEDPPHPGILTRRDGEEQKKELVEEKEEVDIKSLDFNDINEVLFSKKYPRRQHVQMILIFKFTGGTTRYNVN